MSAPATSLGEALAALAGTHPDLPAITCGERTVTWAELERTTNRLARDYQARGVAPDSFVTIMVPNSIGFFEAALATWKCGATPQPISNRLPVAERDAIIELAQPSLVVGSPGESIAGALSVPLGHVADAGLDDSPLAPLIASAYKAPTSGGSTGRPKLIVAGHPATMQTFAPTFALTRMQQGGVHLCTGPLHHNGPFLFSMTALFHGNHIGVMERFDAAAALELVERYGVDWMYMVPTTMGRVWRLDPAIRESRDVSSLRTVFHTAAPCPPWLKQAWIEWIGGEKIVEIYAGTEGQAVAGIDGNEWLAHPGSVGRAIGGEFMVRDADGNDLPAGEVGTIWMRNPNPRPTYRYIGATARTMDGGWETLGDLGRIDEEGYLFLSDRETDMILVGGSNVYPAEVEAALSEHPLVGDACVIGLPDDDLGAVPHAVVFLTGDVSDDELREHVRSRLAPYKTPRSFERVTERLRDDAGKMRRSALRAERLPNANRA
ncbi:MAG TPA: AMP-binding protein [Acidimicrobiales bacterium]|jgi:bile acid-coenzyme A ligase